MSITIEEIKINPNLIMFHQDLPLELQKVAIEKRPALVDTLVNKPIELLEVAFINGYFSDSVAMHLDKYSEESICSFIANAVEFNLDRFLARKKEAKEMLSEKVSIALISKNSNYYGLEILTRSSDMDWDILKETTSMDIDSINPLCNIENLKQEHVDYMYGRFGKFAFLNLSGSYQRVEQKEEIIRKNSYDYPYVEFDDNIAEIYVTDYNASLPYVMKQSKYDPYYETRVLFILSKFGAAIQWVINPTEEMQIIAVKNNPLSIQYIENPCETACIIAVQSDKDAGEYIEKKSKEVCKILGIAYVKPSKYFANKKYLVTLSNMGQNCYRSMMGNEVDSYLNNQVSKDSLGTAKKIATVKEMTDEEEKVLKKFGLFKTINPFFID